LVAGHPDYPLNAILKARFLWLLWIAVIALFVAVWLYPVSNVLTRASGLVLFFLAWFGFIALTWRFRVARFVLVAVTVLFAGFMALPSRSHGDASSLRAAYVEGLRRYEGVTYYWGGESPKGIDCSGIIRRGLIDSLFLRGIRTFDPGSVRYAIWLWWNDCSARDLCDGHGLTSRLSTTPSINVLDHSRILPGDLASNGVHIMAFVGDNRWIEADPAIGRVVIVSVPTEDSLWFREPMTIVRWSILAQ